MRSKTLRRVLTAAAMTVGVVGLGATAAAADTYEVQSGDTLSSIARGHEQVSSWQDLFAANDGKLSDPNLIFPGQTLQLTASGSSSGSATSETSASSSNTSSSTATQTSGSVSVSTWDRLAECESNGNWSINTGNGYYGGLQFSLSSWQWVGGSGYPHQASKAEQIHRAEILLERQGWGAWPACSSALGLR